MDKTRLIKLDVYFFKIFLKMDNHEMDKNSLFLLIDK